MRCLHKILRAKWILNTNSELGPYRGEKFRTVTDKVTDLHYQDPLPYLDTKDILQWNLYILDPDNASDLETLVYPCYVFLRRLLFLIELGDFPTDFVQIRICYSRMYNKNSSFRGSHHAAKKPCFFNTLKYCFKCRVSKKKMLLQNPLRTHRVSLELPNFLASSDWWEIFKFCHSCQNRLKKAENKEMQKILIKNFFIISFSGSEKLLNARQWQEIYKILLRSLLHSLLY